MRLETDAEDAKCASAPFITAIIGSEKLITNSHRYYRRFCVGTRVNNIRVKIFMAEGAIILRCNASLWFKLTTQWPGRGFNTCSRAQANALQINGTYARDSFENGRIIESGWH